MDNWPYYCYILCTFSTSDLMLGSGIASLAMVALEMSLVFIYLYMPGDNRGKPCPSCTTDMAIQVPRYW